MISGCEGVEGVRKQCRSLPTFLFHQVMNNIDRSKEYAFEHNSNLLFWESVRQPFVALSTCESEPGTLKAIKLAKE